MELEMRSGQEPARTPASRMESAMKTIFVALFATILLAAASSAGAAKKEKARFDPGRQHTVNEWCGFTFDQKMQICQSRGGVQCGVWVNNQTAKRC